MDHTFNELKSKAQISCKVITQLICAGFLMMWLMFLVELILLLFPVGKKFNFITVIVVDNKYCQLHP